MSPYLRTIRITKLQNFGRGAREMMELRGEPLFGRPGADYPVGHTYDRQMQDLLHLAEKGSRIVTVGLSGADDAGDGPCITSVVEGVAV